MSYKLEALYKELPWLVVLRKEIGEPSFVKVKRLDAESAKRWIGRVVTSDDSYNISGYFFDSKGGCISKIYPQKPAGVLKRILTFFSQRDTTTIEETLRQCANKDEVRYIVLFGYDLNHYGSNQLYVYKIPQGRTVSDFLQEVADQRAQESNIKSTQASEEIAAELSELSE